VCVRVCVCVSAGEGGPVAGPVRRASEADGEELHPHQGRPPCPGGGGPWAGEEPDAAGILGCTSHCLKHSNLITNSCNSAISDLMNVRISCVHERSEESYRINIYGTKHCDIVAIG